MSTDIVITEKSSQARDVRAALGNRYGTILPAEGHLITLLERVRRGPAICRW
jgi:DNA topoisomerase-3